MSDFQEFPKCLYEGGDTTKAFVIVADKAEEAAQAELGYEPGKLPAEAEVVDDVDALRAEAEAMGIAVDSRWGVKRLKAEIAKAQ